MVQTDPAVRAGTLRSLKLTNFKAFREFTVNFEDHTVLVGPNNAGKSTVIAALRVCSTMLARALQRSPDIDVSFRDESHRAYVIKAGSSGIVEENLRHEFNDVLSLIELTFRNGSSVTIAWPSESVPSPLIDSIRPVFFLQTKDGYQPRSPADVRRLFSNFATVPVLSPLEQDEYLVEPRTIQRALSTRITSRHFRNQLRVMESDGYPEFVEFLQYWAPEIELLNIANHFTDRGAVLDLYFREADKRASKEIFWVGDGLQIWLQILLRIFQLTTEKVIVLDEPDVYLHPDLQRRLVELLNSTDCQTIMATHSPEIISESPIGSVVWLDRSRRAAINGPKAETLAELSTALGSQFNLRLAKALRSRVVLFVEGKDMQIVRHIARTLGLSKLSREQGIAVIPLEGFTNWVHVEPFKWLLNSLLDDSLKVFVVLDRDYRTDDAADAVVRSLKKLGMEAHVWKRKELESYLIVPSAIARIGKTSQPTVENWLLGETEDMKRTVFSRALYDYIDDARAHGSKAHDVSLTESFSKAFDKRWADALERLTMCPPKKLISRLNKRLSEHGHPTISARKLASALEAPEVAIEMRNLLQSVEDAATP